MSETEAQNEPSMEEILASIRRIISEDDSDKDEEGAPEETALTARSDQDAGADESGDDDLDGQDEGDEEPVELTRMVDQAGRVVDLKAGDEIAGAQESEDEAAVTVAEKDEEVSSKLTAEKLEESVADALKDDAETATQAAEGVVELVDKKDDQNAGVAPAPEAEDTAVDIEGLVSPHTKKAAAASLAQVISAAAVPDAKPHPVGGERTLEAVVCDALQPELRAWLDENLAPLVERIVREEIKKLVRRVEDR